ncbi:MAG: cytochrome c-type biogenesis protein CcmH [Acidobacteria bacterium]|nr:cytochrome c-type biogenesis protein CcmH [Acidobacteriota bacterium]
MGILTSLFVALVLTTAPQDPQALEQEAKQIEAMLIAPCCWSQQVSLHQSPAADDIKANIRRLLAQNKTRQQILDAYVSEYGDRILAEPPARGFSAALYVLPWVFLAGSVGLVVAVVRRLRAGASPPPPATPSTPATESDAETDRLDEELRNLD